tara:strand:- start:156 stop:389 length:234 start_codon:yes stop_codon:yes gene_type:complete
MGVQLTAQSKLVSHASVNAAPFAYLNVAMAFYPHTKRATMPTGLAETVARVTVSWKVDTFASNKTTTHHTVSQKLKN